VILTVVAWPPAEQLPNGLRRSDWLLRTFEDVACDKVADFDSTLGRGGMSDMSFRFEWQAPKRLNLTCIYAEDMPVPYRVGAASTVWRRIDEDLSRLWLIGEYPRALVPIFMRQRRERLSSLAWHDQVSSLWASIVRAEPLVKLLAGQPSQCERLLGLMGDAERDEDTFSAFWEAADCPSSCTGESLREAPLVSHYRTAIRFGNKGVGVQPVDMIAAAAENLLYGRHLLDRRFKLELSDSGLAAAEDLDWYADWTDLHAPGGSGISGVVARCRFRTSKELAMVEDLSRT